MSKRSLIELNHRLRYYPFMVNLDKCHGSCKTFDDLSGRTCVSNKTKKINMNAFNMTAKIIEHILL